MDNNRGSANLNDEQKNSLEKATPTCVTTQSNKEAKLYVVPELKTLALLRTLSSLQMKQETEVLKSKAGDESRK